MKHRAARHFSIELSDEVAEQLHCIAGTRGHSSRSMALLYVLQCVKMEYDEAKAIVDRQEAGAVAATEAEAKRKAEFDAEMKERDRKSKEAWAALLRGV